MRLVSIHLLVSLALLAAAPPAVLAQPAGDHSSCGSGPGPFPLPPGSAMREGQGAVEGAGTGPRPGCSSMPLPPYLRGVDLSSAQRQKIADIFAAEMPRADGPARNLEDVHRGLALLAFSDAYDDAAAQSLAQSAATSLVQAAVVHARLDHAVYLVLTPQQRQQLAERVAHPDSEHPHPGGDRAPPR